MNQIISVRSAALTYQARNGEVEALPSVSFDMAEGEFVSIVGPSGCGKSTLLVPMFITTLSQTRMKSRFLAADEYISPKKSNSVGASWLKPSRKIAHLRLSSPPYIMEAQRRQAR